MLATTLAMLTMAHFEQAINSRQVKLIPLGETTLVRILDLKKATVSEDGFTLELPKIAQGSWGEQCVLSWNLSSASDATFTFELRGDYRDFKSPYYKVGTWTSDTTRGVRQSTNDQSDHLAEVLTDTLIFKKIPNYIDLRITSNRSFISEDSPKLKALYLSLTRVKGFDPVPPTAEEFAKPWKVNRNEQSKETDPVFVVYMGAFPWETPAMENWGKMLFVPERCQGDYPNGKVICSPTSLSMIMAYWAQKLNRPELDEGVEKVCKAVHDPSWPGTGNWPFNTAYAGSFPGMRGIVAYLRSSAHLEELISKGIPVACSVSYDLLKGKGKRGKNDGHIVVCVGFTKDGDPIFNDPGRKEVRFTYDRWDFEKAWATSNRATYLVFPESLDSALDPIWGPRSGP